jgi:hypothetical protein
MDNTKVDVQKETQKKTAKAVFKNDSLVLTVPDQLPVSGLDETTELLGCIFSSMRKNAEKTGVKSMSFDAVQARFCNLVNKRVESAIIPLSGKAHLREYVSMTSVAFAVSIDCIGRKSDFIAVTRDSHGHTALMIVDTRPFTYTGEKQKSNNGKIFDLLAALGRLTEKCVTERQSIALNKAIDSAKSVLLDGEAEKE